MWFCHETVKFTQHTTQRRFGLAWVAFWVSLKGGEKDWTPSFTLIFNTNKPKKERETLFRVHWLDGHTYRQSKEKERKRENWKRGNLSVAPWNFCSDSLGAQLAFHHHNQTVLIGIDSFEEAVYLSLTVPGLEILDTFQKRQTTFNQIVPPPTSTPLIFPKNCDWLTETHSMSKREKEEKGEDSII